MIIFLMQTVQQSLAVQKGQLHIGVELKLNNTLQHLTCSACGAE